MTIASETSKIAYNGNGSTTRFAIPFAYLRDSDLSVLLRREDGTEETRTISTHYSLEAEELGGTCVMLVAPLAGETLVIKRDPAIVQETAYEEGVPLSAKSREDALDLLTMIAQANRERVDRAVKFSPTSQQNEVSMPTPQAGHSLVWNDDGSSLANGPTVATIDTAVSSAASAEEAASLAEASANTAQDAKTAAETARDEARAIADLEAAGVPYDNGSSGLAGTDVQAAVDELAANTDSLGTASAKDVGTGEGNVPVLRADGGMSLPGPFHCTTNADNALTVVDSEGGTHNGITMDGDFNFTVGPHDPRCQVNMRVPTGTGKRDLVTEFGQIYGIDTASDLDRTTTILNANGMDATPLGTGGGALTSTIDSSSRGLLNFATLANNVGDGYLLEWPLMCAKISAFELIHFQFDIPTYSRLNAEWGLWDGTTNNAIYVRRIESAGAASTFHLRTAKDGTATDVGLSYGNNSSRWIIRLHNNGNTKIEALLSNSSVNNGVLFHAGNSTTNIPDAQIWPFVRFRSYGEVANRTLRMDQVVAKFAR